MSEKIKMVGAPDARGNILYDITKFVVTKTKMKQSLAGTKDEVLARAAKMNMLGVKLVRTKTIAEGGDVCDFRYSLKK